MFKKYVSKIIFSEVFKMKNYVSPEADIREVAVNEIMIKSGKDTDVNVESLNEGDN